MKTFRILCIDGGGIKGLYSAQVLSSFEDHFKVLVSDCFDMICGTSTGGIIAMGASLKIPMHEIVDFYDRRGPEIFRQYYKDRYNLKFSIGDKLLGLKQALLSSKYDGTHLRKALYDVFGTKVLDDAFNLLCIPSYDITSAQTRVFKNGPWGSDGHLSFVDVALATSAAPTYFPIMKIGGKEYIDGGLWANNPTVVALTEFLRNYLKPFHVRKKEDWDSVEILSVSSCEKFMGQVSKRKDRSFFRWKDTIFDIYSSGQEQSDDDLLVNMSEHLDFQLDITRVTHKALSRDQERHVASDNADNATRSLLKIIARRTATRYIDDPAVLRLFR